MIDVVETIVPDNIKYRDLPAESYESLLIQEESSSLENINNKTTEKPDIAFIESISRAALIEQNAIATVENSSDNREGLAESDVTVQELSDEEKAKIKEESGWSDEIIDNIQNMQQYEVLKNAELKEGEINGRKCLIKEIDLDYTDADGISNRDRIARGLAPLDSKTGKPIELHHLGQKADSPLVELTVEEHRTGEYEDGKKNQSLWHDNTLETEVHGEGNTWTQERKAHWQSRSE
jgi:hypothetical protein